jgi:hypothetical protein
MKKRILAVILAASSVLMAESPNADQDSAQSKKITVRLPVATAEGFTKAMDKIAEVRLKHADRDIELLLPVGIDVSKDIKKVYNLYSESVDAPIAKDTVVGEISLIYNGEILATSKLLTTTSVERSNTLYYIDLIDQIIGTTWFKVSLASFIVIGMAYLCLSVFRKSKRNKKNKNLLN